MFYCAASPTFHTCSFGSAASFASEPVGMGSHDWL